MLKWTKRDKKNWEAKAGNLHFRLLRRKANRVDLLLREGMERPIHLGDFSPLSARLKAEAIAKEKLSFLDQLLLHVQDD